MSERFTTWLEPTTVEEAQEAIREASNLVSLTNYRLLDQVSLPWASAVYADKLARAWVDEEDQEDSDELAFWIQLAEKQQADPITVVSPEINNTWRVDAEDFVAEIPAHWILERIRIELEPYGLALPHASVMWLNSTWSEDAQMASGEFGMAMSLADHVGWNLPHLLSAQHGSWRDWVLGCSFLTADGEVCRSGSQVTKNVAGFDLHKFLIGSRSAFAIPLSFTLRVVPIAAVREPQLRVSRYYGRQYNDPSSRWTIQRVRDSDFELACRDGLSRSWIADLASQTIYRYAAPDVVLTRFPGDWIYRVGGPPWPEFTEAEAWVVRRTKQLFDPANKLNPGILGIV